MILRGFSLNNNTTRLKRTNERRRRKRVIDKNEMCSVCLVDMHTTEIRRHRPIRFGGFERVYCVAARALLVLIYEHAVAIYTGSMYVIIRYKYMYTLAVDCFGALL